MAEAGRIVTGFARALRAQGISLPTGSVVLFAEALALVGLGPGPGAAYWAGRATLICRPEDIPVYDRVFASYWQDRVPGGQRAPGAGSSLTLAVDTHDAGPEPAGDDGAGEDLSDEVLALRYSAVEVLRDRDLASLAAEEWAEAERLVSALRVSSELRPSRRTRPSRRRSHGPPDLRATVRRNMPAGGVPIRRAWRTAVERPRRMVFLLDVSGSMEPYARGLVRFAHAAVASRRAGRVEVFTMGTRLTRITRELGRRDPDAALSAAAAAVSDWSGGTRLGGSLEEFNRVWGIRGLARGAVVVICSDGWDRGAPGMVASEMARLSRVAHRIVWVNPLKASPGYAPLARGMAAALPYVDQFVEGHSVASLEDLALTIAGAGVRVPVPAGAPAAAGAAAAAGAPTKEVQL
ncbi:MAG: vWA domain-containing protein [Acidimicrobiales bacterium]